MPECELPNPPGRWVAAAALLGVPILVDLVFVGISGTFAYYLPLRELSLEALGILALLPVLGMFLGGFLAPRKLVYAAVAIPLSLLMPCCVVAPILQAAEGPFDHEGRTWFVVYGGGGQADEYGGYTWTGQVFECDGNWCWGCGMIDAEGGESWGASAPRDQLVNACPE